MRIAFDRKKTITISVIAALALILGGAYLWYARTYGNAEKIVLTSSEVVDYEWKSIASSHGITGDYLWSRTRQLMIEDREDGTLIPSSYMIEGRLSYEEAEESGVYLLSDQARLLKLYVKTSDRFKASDLRTEVNNRFDMSEQPLDEKAMWLEAYLYYYVSYGNADDYQKILDLISQIFDESGLMRPEDISIASFDEGAFYSTATYQGEEIPQSILESPAGTEYDSELVTVNAVKLSAVRLSMIRDLENNGLLPAGSYDRNLQIVTGGVASDSIPLYAYAYQVLEDGSISYIYSGRTVATIDVGESIATMRNLAKVDALPDASLNWIRNNILNNGSIKSTYSIITGTTDGEEAYDSYTDILAIAFETEDTDLYDRICTLLGVRVATYSSSPALSMIYRQQDDRFYFTARENLEVSLALL